MKRLLCLLILYGSIGYAQENKVFSRDVEAALYQYQNIKDKKGVVRITTYHILAYKKDGVFARVAPSNATLLHTAAQAGATDLVVALIDAGVSPGLETEDLQTPLHWAALGGNLVSAEILLTADADPNAVDNNKRTPLWLAAASGNTATALLLLRFGADPNIKGLDPETAYGYTPYKVAQSKGHKDTAALIHSMGGQ